MWRLQRRVSQPATGCILPHVWQLRYDVAVVQSGRGLVAEIIDAATQLNPGDNMSPGVLAAMDRHLRERRVHRSAETGAGGSTLLFSHLSPHHTVFAIEGENKIISRVRSSLLLRKEAAEFIEGPTQKTLPAYGFDGPLEAVLIDGPHAFPFPQLEYFYFYPHLAVDGLLILDDIHIRSIHELFLFLCADEMFELVEVVERTAFFRRTDAPVFDPFGDGWRQQAYNRKRLFRFVAWEALADRLPASLKGYLRQSRALVGGSWRAVRYQVRIEMPRRDAAVGPTALVCGRAALPVNAHLWLFARRSDDSGWWPQGGGPVPVSGGEWQQTCQFGGADDDGRMFEIAAIAIDLQRHNRLLRWFTEGTASGIWAGLKLPEPVRGSSLASTRVLRARASC